MERPPFVSNEGLARDFSHRMNLQPAALPVCRPATRRAPNSSRALERSSRISRPCNGGTSSNQAATRPPPRRSQSLRASGAARDSVSNKARTYQQAAWMHLHPYPQRPLSWQPWSSNIFDLPQYISPYYSALAEEEQQQQRAAVCRTSASPFYLQSSQTFSVPDGNPTHNFLNYSGYGNERHHSLHDDAQDETVARAMPYIQAVDAGRMTQDYYGAINTASFDVEPSLYPVQIYDDDDDDHDVNTNSEPEVDDLDKGDLVGMGIYDKPATELHSAFLFSGSHHGVGIGGGGGGGGGGIGGAGNGKGLKLEEGFVPVEEEEDDDLQSGGAGRAEVDAFDGGINAAVPSSSNTSPTDSVPELDFDDHLDDESGSSCRWPSFDYERIYRQQQSSPPLPAPPPPGYQQSYNNDYYYYTHPAGSDPTANYGVASSSPPPPPAAAYQNNYGGRWDDSGASWAPAAATAAGHDASYPPHRNVYDPDSGYYYSVC